MNHVRLIHAPEGQQELSVRVAIDLPQVCVWLFRDGTLLKFERYNVDPDHQAVRL